MINQKKRTSLSTGRPTAHPTHMADASGGRLSAELIHGSLPLWQPLQKQQVASAEIHEHTLLTQLMQAVMPRAKNREDDCTRLLGQFGSLSAVMQAPYHELKAACGGSEVLSVYFSVVSDAARRMHLARLKTGRPLLEKNQLMAYLQTVMGHETIEQMRVLFLDGAYCLLADEVTGRGTINHAPVYPREVMKRALALQAHSLVLVHNHPSGDPSPSDDDIAMTHHIEQAAAVMGLHVHDHIIIGRGRMVSLREEGFL